MNKTLNKSLILGLILVAAGIIFAGNELGFWYIDIFFEGWWTLFIIIPCIISIVQNGFNTGNIIGLCIGAFFLLQQQSLFYEYRKLVFPVGIVAIGLILILKQNDKHRSAADEQNATQQGNYGNNEESAKKEYKNTFDIVRATAVFSGQNINKNNEVFNGADLTAVFGGIDLDIRNSVIQKDVRIDALCLFGGIDIYVPQNIQVKVHSTSVFGGVDNFAANSAGNHVINVYCTCIFGGIDIKYNKT